MLQIKNLVKDYVQKDIDTVHALRGINIDFRKNEFVAILGPSGCGKTTFLNIIGGLDRYTDGDLLIKGKSTKQYKDKDWDTYRNHSVGFVFQSYNLIPHQTILQNVELALTISGISKKERKERAREALAKVGLSKMENKKPNQMSGGQMQRVAIARALVNNPEILLADEPTGALDSVTSVQVMDLLKEVAKDRLVIMVTHNPDLANKYASRIINFFDGQLTGDSNPYTAKPEDFEEAETTNKGKKYSQMKFFTAFGLSLSNLFSKSKRTILVAVAGSIGIVGVSSVLAVSQGIKDYIVSMQDDMLSSYPIGISEEAVDYSSLMSGLQEEEVVKDVVFDKKTEVGLDSMIAYLMDKYKDFTSVKTNDINADLLAYIENAPEEAVAAKKYNYSIDVTNNIYTSFKKTGDDTSNTMMSLNGITQKYIAELKTVDGFAEYAQFVDLFTDFMKQLPDNEEYVMGNAEMQGQYKMLAGSYPKEMNEILLVVDPNKQTLTDINFAQMGFYPEEDFLNIAMKAIAENDETSSDYGKSPEELERLYPYSKSFKFEDLLNKKLTYYPHNTIYTYGEIAASESRSISITTLVGTTFVSLNYDFDNDAFTGTGIDVTDLAHISLDSMKKIALKRSSGTSKDNALPQYGIFEGTNDGAPCKWKIVKQGENDLIFNITNDPESTTPIAADCISDTTSPSVTGYHYPAVSNPAWTNGVDLKISGIAIAGDNTQFGCLQRGIYYTKDFGEKYMADALNSDIVKGEHGIISHIGTANESSSSFKAYVTYDYDSYKDDADNPVIAKGYASCLNADMATSLSSLFSGFSGGLNYFEVDKIYLRSLSGLSVKKIAPTSTSITALNKTETVDGVETNYTFEKLPQSISLYPTSFEMKNTLTDYLNKWNSDETLTINGKQLARAERDDLTYIDTIETIIAVITTLIDIVSVALIIFTSLSLVVSCFMIAVITYISVMERVKEIGIIRSLGGRKRDVNRLFTAENLITGLSSGLVGIGFTYVLQIIANLILTSLTYPAICALSIKDALIMIGVSILLSVFSGFIPSRNASKQDPVVALRSE